MKYSEEKKIYYGGSIITMEDEFPYVEALVVEGQKIIDLGKLQEIREKYNKNSIEIDLKGNTLLPGFIDSHIHPFGYMFYLHSLDLFNLRSLEELLRVLEESAEKKNLDELVLGLRLNEENFKDPKLPTRWDLDKACPNHPVFLLRYDGHIGVANSKTLELIKIKDKIKSIEGAEARKNKEGEFTGVLSENAIGLITPLIKAPKDQELSKMVEGMCESLAEMGITSIHGLIQLDDESGVLNFGENEMKLLRLSREHVIQDVYAFLFTNFPDKLNNIKDMKPFNEKEEGVIKLAGLKLFSDGSFGGATAAMFEPFEDQPDKIGFIVEDVEKIYQKMEKAHLNNFQIAIHAIGDKANREVTNLYQKLLKKHPREDHRHRIEHASILTEDTIKDIKDLGLVVSFQPQFINSEYTWLEKRLGSKRCERTYPVKTLIDSGVIICSGSDSPVEMPNVIKGLHALVTRNGFQPQECISMWDALKTFTINAAYASFQEQLKGTLSPGKYADLVILDKNPLEIKNDKIKEIKVLETIKRGKTVFKKIG
ncbi:MAG: N-substituted formamide deformylase [Promethearchaeota archaeon]|nr:MAG: N-substituted formamide deformylase [Candidatus Lokiarchaeota archaeon]